MSDIGIAGGVTSVSPGTNIRITSSPTVAPTPQFNILDFLKSTTAKDIGKTVGDMVIPGRNTPLGIFSVVAKDPTISVMNALAGAMMNINKNVQQTTSGLLGGLKEEAEKAKTGPTVDSAYDMFGNIVTAPTPTVTGQTLTPVVNRDLTPLGLPSLVDRSLEQTQQQDIGGFYE